MTFFPRHCQQAFQETLRIERRLAFVFDQRLDCRCRQNIRRNLAGPALHQPIPELRIGSKPGERLEPPINCRHPRTDFGLAE